MDKDGVYRPRSLGEKAKLGYLRLYLGMYQFTSLNMKIRTLVSAPAARPCLVITTHSPAQVL